jgi:adenylyl cyclase-associated protein
LNKGSDITSGLKKVSKQKAASSKVVMKEKKTQTKKKMGTPKLALDGRKWLCEFYIDDRTGNLVISDCDVKQTVTIFRCVNCVVQIKGKINAVLLDDCDKTSIVCSDVVSSIDIVNCTSVEVQADGNVPTIAVDKTDGCQLYLGTTAMSGDGPTIIMSKSSECNVTTPGATEDDDGVEQALPEQFSNLFVNGKWETTPVTHG